MKHAAFALLAALVVTTPAMAQKARGKAAEPAKEENLSGPISLTDLKIQLFLEKSGTLSENLVGTKKKFVNTVLGEGDAGEPADAVLITLTFEGTKNTRASDKLARDLAQVKVTQATKAGTRIVLNRVYGGFIFGDTGLSHKALVIDNATCDPLEVEAKIGKTKKTAKIEFSCNFKK